MTERCKICHETPHESDPGLSNSICVFCGYWNVNVGPDRDAIRAKRYASQQAAEAAKNNEGDDLQELKINISVKRDDSGFYYAVASVPGLKTFEPCASRSRGKAIAYALTEIAVTAAKLP